MIAALLLALPGPTIPIEILQEPGDEIRFEAAIVVPSDLDADERALLPALASAMESATEDFQPSAILAITDGRPLRVEAMADHLRVSFGVAANAENAGLELFASVLRRPLFREGAKAALPSGFYAPLLGGEFAVGKIPANELRILYQRVVRPERIHIGVAGPVSADVATKLGQRLADWPRAVKANPYRKRPSFERMSADNALLMLRSPIVAYDAPDLSVRMVVWAAVGVGKGSSLFRAARDRLGMSYRQEALFVPTDKGFVPTIALATEHPDAEALRKALLEEIDGWTDADIARAKGVLRANEETGLPLSPLLLGLDGPPTNDAADRAFLAAYWPLRTGHPWNPLYWAVDLDLETLKKLAKEAVKAAK